MFFASNDQCSLADLKKKNKTVGKSAKGYRIPKQILVERIVDLINYSKLLIKIIYNSMILLHLP